jgi:hypothetical protein
MRSAKGETALPASTIKIGLIASFVAMSAPALAADAYCPNPAHQTPTKPPSELVPSVAKALKLEPSEINDSVFVRCAGRTLMACTVGANLNCFKADTRRELPGATAWCRDNPDSADIPMAATGHDTIYAWSCKGSKAVADVVVLKVDPQGYIADNWTAVR